MSFAFLCPNCSFCFYYSFYVCFLVLLSILCVLCLCIVSFLLMYTVVSFLFVHKFTDDCHRVKTKLQLIHIICLHLPHDFMACKGTPLPLLTPVSLRWSLSLKCWENFDFRLSSCNEYWFLVLGILHGVQGKFPDVLVPTAAPQTSAGNLPCTPCRIPKTKNLRKFVSIQYTDMRSPFATRFRPCVLASDIVQVGSLTSKFRRNTLPSASWLNDWLRSNSRSSDFWRAFTLHPHHVPQITSWSAVMRLLQLWRWHSTFLRNVGVTQKPIRCKNPEDHRMSSYGVGRKRCKISILLHRTVKVSGSNLARGLTALTVLHHLPHFPHVKHERTLRHVQPFMDLAAVGTWFPTFRRTAVLPSPRVKQFQNNAR